MKSFGKPLLSLAAPLLILLAILGFFQRQDGDRLQSLPALVVGVGLIVSSAVGRRLRRKQLLNALAQIEKDMS